MSIILNKEHEGDLLADSNGRIVRAPLHFDYLFRPRQLWEISFVEFVAKYVRRRAYNGDTSQSETGLFF